MYNEVYGDLIKLAKEGNFDVIAHGCNCYCTMGAGIAPQMAAAFGADRFRLENPQYRGKYEKLGNIDYKQVSITPIYRKIIINGIETNTPDYEKKEIYVVNAYTQYGFGRNHEEGELVPLDYEALTLCLRKINKVFKGKHIGLPQIGCGLAGGDWEIVKQIIQKELKDCDVTVVIFKKDCEL